MAAALLKDAGYEVIGATMQVWPRDQGDTPSSCCGLNAIEDARRVAYRLGIPHYTLNFRDVFAGKVIADFCGEYSRGRTPNPCIRCNQYIKFGALLDKARELGADFVATGHHARIQVNSSRGTFQLKKGVDQQKDQSYFLYTLTQEQLSHALLPVGDYTKGEVREMAGAYGLPVASKPGSVEICFIPDDDHARFLRDNVPRTVSPGPVLDRLGRTVGRHEGIAFYTIGQRKGLGVCSGSAQYVVAIDPERNAIIVGGKEDTYGSELRAVRLNWIGISRPEKPVMVKAKIRYRHPEALAEVIPLGEDEVLVRFREPQMAITPGQAIVFYDGDVVIGGGTIERVLKGDKDCAREAETCPSCPN